MKLPPICAELPLSEKPENTKSTPPIRADRTADKPSTEATFTLVAFDLREMTRTTKDVPKIRNPREP